MKYARIIHAVTNTAWAVTEEKLLDIVEFLQMKADGLSIDMSSFEEVHPLKVSARSRITDRSNTDNKSAIAVIPIRGVISHRMNMMSAISGGTSTEEVGAVFDEFATNPKVGTIVLDIDSPGGNVVGVQELADQIFAARDAVRIIAVANSMAASAAYWIGSQAHEFSVMPSGSVGSIGVLAVHRAMFSEDSDERKLVTIMKAGKFKGESNPFEPLSEEAKDNMQGRIDRTYGTIISNVARGRGVSEDVVRKEFGQGRTVEASEAERLGMVDRIETLNETLTRLSNTNPDPTSNTAFANVSNTILVSNERVQSSARTIVNTMEGHMKAKIDESKLDAKEVEELHRLQAIDNDNDNDNDNADDDGDEGQTLSPSVIENLPQEVRDRLTAQDAAIATANIAAEAARIEATVEREAREARESRDEAQTLFPNLPGTPSEKGSMLQSIRTLADTESEAIITRLSSGDAAIKSLMTEQGTHRVGFGSAFEEMESKADALIAADPKLTKAKAISKIAKSNKELYARYQEEQRS